MADMRELLRRKSISFLWKWEHWKLAKRSGAYYFNDAWRERNVVTDEGLTYLLDAGFSGGEQKTAWYVEIFDDDYTPLTGDTYQAPGFNESVAYEGPRPTWQEAGVSLLSITNAANPASFTMTGSATIFGGALTSANTKGDTVSGEVLYCASKFPTSREVEDDDIFKVVATLGAEDV